MQKTLLAGEYTISSQIVINTPDRRAELWSAKDALVFKAMSIVPEEHLKPVLSHNCYHLKDHGGAKSTVRATARYLKKGQHVMKSDVKGYYASINHEIFYNHQYPCRACIACQIQLSRMLLHEKHEPRLQVFHV